MKNKKLVFKDEDEDDTKLQDPKISTTTPSKIKKKSKKPSKKDEKQAVAAATDDAGESKPLKLVTKPTFLSGQLNARNKPLIRHPGPTAKWFEYQADEVVSSEAEAESTRTHREAFRAYAARLLDTDERLYESKRGASGGGEAAWLGSAAGGGTASDQMAALTLLCQESPPHALARLDALTDKLRKSRHDALGSLDTVRDLWLESLLPERRLVALEKRPLLRVDALSSGNRDSRDKRLLLWLFEDRLREAYANLVRELGRLCADSVAATRVKAARTALQLLLGRPEQEQLLLSTVVNKLGDTDHTVAAKVSNMLLHLLSVHPNMKTVLVTELERLLYRPNVSQRAQFYGVCTLSQVMLRASEKELAAQLLRIYFALFQIMVKKDAVDNRMLSVLLAGTNRAFPYAKGAMAGLAKDLDSLYRVAGVAKLPVALQTLSLLFQVLEDGDGVSDRFFSALYRRLRDPALLGATSRHTQLFSLLFKSLKADPVEGRVGAFVKRLLQLALCSAASFAAGVLLLLAALQTEKPGLLRLSKPAQAAFLEAAEGSEESDDEEHFRDLRAPDDDAEEGREEETATKAKHSWHHRENYPGKRKKGLGDYDSEARNPLFANAEASLPYELVLLSRHFHPSVCLFATTLLRGKELRYAGDPLVDFTLMKFLDRFAFRNPKDGGKNKEEGGKEDDAAAPRRRITSRKSAYRPAAVKSLAVDSAEYVARKSADVPADERFLHTYMNTFETARRKNKRAQDSDGESVASDEAERIIGAFEPGDANRDVFDVDFESEFSAGSSVIKRKPRKKAAHESDGESDFSDDEDEEQPETKKSKGKKRHRSLEEDEEFGEMLEEAGAEEDEEQGKSKGMRAYLRRPAAKNAKRMARAKRR